MDSRHDSLAPAFWSRRAARLAPLFLTCEHASRRLPPALEADPIGRELLQTHWGFDLGGWALALELSRRLGCTLVGGAWTRLAIDLNRAPGDPTLIRAAAGEVDVGWNRSLSVREAIRRIDAWHAPYHAEVDRRIVRHVLHGVRPLILLIHSFTPELNGKHRPFDAGVLFREHEGPGRKLAARLRAAGLAVRLNQPYSGLDGLIYSAERHGALHRLPCLELEVNQALFDRRHAASRLGAAVSRALAGNAV